MTLRSKLNGNLLIRSLASIRITVTCLFLLFILTFWGTVAQVQQGLYQAQHEFFFSWYFLGFGFLPFPGAQLVLWVLFVNLVCVALTRFVYRWSHLGIVIIHTGLLTYFFSAFILFHVVKESNVTLLEGESTNVSVTYHDWELSIWESEINNQKKVFAYDAKTFNPGVSLPEFQLMVKNYYPNASAFTNSNPQNITILNSSHITGFADQRVKIEPEKNIPGLILETQGIKDNPLLMLYGAEIKPTAFQSRGKTYFAQLRRKHYQLPFTITLKDFQKELHPGTDIARSYKSSVIVEHDGVNREALIYMNNPLTSRDFILFQASYSVDEMGREASTFAVVQNKGRILPYISSLLTFAGLATHFLMMALKRKKKQA